MSELITAQLFVIVNVSLLKYLAEKIQTTKLLRAFVINEVSTEPFRQSFGSLLLKADPENQSLDFEEQFKDKHLCQQFDSLLNVTDPNEVVLVEKKC